MPTIKQARTDEELLKCYPLIEQMGGGRCEELTPEAFLIQARRQMEKEGYLIYFIEKDRKTKSLAGFRYMETLASGKIMFVDDLVTEENERSKGYGKQLLDWLKEEAKEKGCDQIHLDSSTHRKQAHKFYFREGFHISCHHFEMDLD